VSRGKLNSEVAGHADFRATILARKWARMSVSVSVSVSVPWNSSFIRCAAGVDMPVDTTPSVSSSFLMMISRIFSQFVVQVLHVGLLHICVCVLVCIRTFVFNSGIWCGGLFMFIHV